MTTQETQLQQRDETSKVVTVTYLVRAKDPDQLNLLHDLEDGGLNRKNGKGFYPTSHVRTYHHKSGSTVALLSFRRYDDGMARVEVTGDEAGIVGATEGLELACREGNLELIREQAK